MRVLAPILCFLTLAACVRLTPAGERVQVLGASQAGLVSACRRLASVSVSSQDALKNAAAAQGGDTAIMNLRDVGTTQYIKGDIYDCSDTVALPAAAPAHREPSPEERADAEYRRKSGLCQAKGGAWINQQCVIVIE